MHARTSDLDRCCPPLPRSLVNVCVRVPCGCVGIPVPRRGPEVFVRSSACVAQTATCGFALVIGIALAAGVTWTSRTTSAPWTARQGHTSVVDADGAIYVIGGGNDGSSTVYHYNDVWVSTDGGADRNRRGSVGIGGYY
jgi:hypothetical protein